MVEGVQLGVERGKEGGGRGREGEMEEEREGRETCIP